MSTHEVLVVRISEVNPHLNADSLELVKMEDNDYTAVARKGEWKVGDLACYCEPDYILNTTLEEFKFLYNGKNDKHRITAKRLRGVWSEGLLFKCQPHHKLGDNVIEEYGIVRYEPPAHGSHTGWGGEGSSMKSGWCAPTPHIEGGKQPVHYSLENYKKNHRVIEPGVEQVIYTSKIHGTNSRFVYSEGRMHAGSRTTWKYAPGTIVSHMNHRTGENEESIAPNNTWWDALAQNPWLEEWCKNHEGVTVYGEVYGTLVQGKVFHYGLGSTELGIRVFDVLRVDGSWVDNGELHSSSEYSTLIKVPVLYQGPHHPEILAELAESPETMNGCNGVREGVVVKPVVERSHDRLGRVALKYVSNIYLQRS